MAINDFNIKNEEQSTIGTQQDKLQAISGDPQLSVDTQLSKIMISFLREVFETPFKIPAEYVTAPFLAKLSKCCGNLFAVRQELLCKKTLEGLFDMAYEYMVRCKELFGTHEKQFLVMTLQTAAKSLELGYKLHKSLDCLRKTIFSW